MAWGWLNTKKALAADSTGLEKNVVDVTAVSDSDGGSGSSIKSLNDDNGINKPHIFQDKDVADHWRAVYERVNYEGRHYFDPDFVWEPREERIVKWKTEFHVTFWAFIMFLALDIDRYNMSNAIAGNLLTDVGLTTNDYNLGVTINLVCFLAAELPSQLISKWIGPDRWIPTQLTLWSVVATCQCKMNSRSSFLATRGLVGMLEGGFIPDMSLWMSYFYTGQEFSVRIGYFYIANPLTQAISALLAYGIFHLDGVGGWHGWQYVFLIEGLVTLGIGLMSFFMMPPSVVQTRKWFRPHGWYTHREEKIMVNRVLRDDPSKGDMNNRQALTPKLLWRSLTDYDLWPIYATRLICDIIAQPISQYVSLLLRSEGLSTLSTNLLLMPYNGLTIITMLLQVHLSAHFKQYGLLLLATPLWLIGPIAAMHWWPGFMVDVWPSYMVLFFALGYPPSWALSITWCSQNSNSVRLRTVSAALVNMCSQAGSIIGSNIFRKDDSPKYPRGTKDIFGIAIGASVMVLVARTYYVLRNKYRDRKWNSLSIQEQEEYIQSTKDLDLGNKRLNFRFAT